MSTDFCKVGLFSDGGGRIRIVKQGYVADPAPSDPRAIIFDSDWPDLLQTAPGFYGNVAVLANTPVTVNFPYNLGFIPQVIVAYQQPNNIFASVSNGLSGASAGGTSYSNLNLPTAGFANNLLNTYLLSTLIGSFNSSLYPSSPVTATSVTMSSSFATVGLYCTLLNNLALVAGNESSRAGAGSYMRLDINGLVITRPGKSIDSTNPLDFIVPPANMQPTLFQPLIATTISSLPWIGNFTETIDQGADTSPRYENFNSGFNGLIIPHNLGYVPITIVTTYSDFRTTNTVGSARCSVDSTNIYLWTNTGPTNSAGSSYNINQISVFVLPQRWV